MYKDSTYAARCRRKDVRRQLAPVPRELDELHGIRWGRILSGAVGVGGFIGMVITAALFQAHARPIIIGTWICMGLALLLSKPLLAARFRRQAAKLFHASEDPFADLARWERERPVAIAAARIARLEGASFMMPLIALTLLVPLSIHLLVGTTALVFTGNRYDAWVLISLLLVGHAHITLLVFSVMHVLCVQRDLDRGERVSGASKGLLALLWTVLASAIPGVVLLCIPPIMVALTGMMFVPWMFQWVAQQAPHERQLLTESQEAPALTLSTSSV